MKTLFNDTVFVYHLPAQFPQETPCLVIFRDEVSEMADEVSTWSKILVHCEEGGDQIMRVGTNRRYTREEAIKHYKELCTPLVHFRTLPSDN